MDLNLALFRAINRSPEVFAPAMRFFSEATNVTAVKYGLLAMVVAMMVRGPKSRSAAILALVSFPLANLITDVWKGALPMPRPFQDLAVSEVILRAGTTENMGTASAHSANMAAVAFAFTYALGWRWGSLWIAVAFLTGVSRIYNGVHYPYQVLLGWACGCFASLVVIKTWEAFRATRKGVSQEPTNGQS